VISWSRQTRQAMSRLRRGDSAAGAGCLRRNRQTRQGRIPLRGHALADTAAMPQAAPQTKSEGVTCGNP